MYLMNVSSFSFFLSFSTPTEQTKTSLLRILSHSVQSREESPEERTSPEKKSFSLRKSVKCTTVFKGRLTQQEALGGVADISLDMFGTNSSKQAKPCRPTVERSRAQQRCIELDKQEGVETRYSQFTTATRLLNQLTAAYLCPQYV